MPFPPDLGTKFVHIVSVLKAGGRDIGRVLYLVWGVYSIDGMSGERKHLTLLKTEFFSFQIDPFTVNTSSA